MPFPIYFPDATRAVIRSLDSVDLRRVHVEGLVTNAYHLMTQPGTTVIESLGGLKKLMDWSGWITVDSGGFQILSMLQRNPALGSISDTGITFHHQVHGQRRKYSFTPEKSIEVQFKLGADILICLDDFTPPGATQAQMDLSVRRTIAWAERCKSRFDELVAQKKLSDQRRPILLGVIQGGEDPKMREKCAQGLIEIGFDGYGFGGWPIKPDGTLDNEIMRITAELMPDHLPKFALGVGAPQNIVAGFKMGYSIFDCVLPTRDARHQRLYVFTVDPQTTDLLTAPEFYQHLHILREKFVRDGRPISEYCDCQTCQRYSRAYLHHLFRIGDATAGRLATIHNLRMYTQLIERLRSYG